MTDPAPVQCGSTLPHDPHSWSERLRETEVFIPRNCPGLEGADRRNPTVHVRSCDRTRPHGVHDWTAQPGDFRCPGVVNDSRHPRLPFGAETDPWRLEVPYDTLRQALVGLAADAAARGDYGTAAEAYAVLAGAPIQQGPPLDSLPRLYTGEALSIALDLTTLTSGGVVVLRGQVPAADDLEAQL